VKAALAALILATSTTGCLVVPQNRRAHLADPMMALGDDPTEVHRKAKFYSTREGAAGGDGVSAGGGCACQ